jgi:hypothetical protein
MYWFNVMKTPAKDKRYKLTLEDINIIRELREEGNILVTIKQILKEKYGINISTATIMYWTNEESRNKQRLKNAKRKYVAGSKENKRRIANDGAKRKENWEADPDMKLRHKLQHAIDEDRSRKTFRHNVTVDGKTYTLDEAKKLIAEGSLKRPNRKFD